jgi:multifunctional beta-oxidation protein
LFEVLGGWAAQTRWQRSGGYSFPSKVPYTPEDVVAKWKSITSFGELYYTLFLTCILNECQDDGRATHPGTTAEALEQVGCSSLWFIFRF